MNRSRPIPARCPFSLILISSVVSGGCVLPPTVQPVPKYYVASVDTSSQAVVTTEDGLKVLDERAAEALRPGLTVAFFPPDRRRVDLSAATTTATPESVEMANECGVLISALETSVADRYTVVSWQTIKGVDPFERAAARNVDVIFEVDSMGMNSVGQDGASQMRLDFHQQTTATDRSVLTLGPEELQVVAGRCKVGVERMLADERAGMVGSFTGAIKAVEVSTGQALVYYQRTLTDDTSSTHSAGFDLYYEAKGVAPDPATAAAAPKRYNTMQNVGGFLAGTGFAMAATGGILRGLVYSGELNEADRFRQPGTSVSVGTLIAGLVVLAGGIAVVSLGNAKAKRSGRPLPYQAPADVLCVQPTTPPWLLEPVQPAQGGSSVSFSETQTAGHDAWRERENRLRKLLIDDFTTQLAGLGRTLSE